MQVFDTRDPVGVAHLELAAGASNPAEMISRLRGDGALVDAWANYGFCLDSIDAFPGQAASAIEESIPAASAERGKPDTRARGPKKFDVVAFDVGDRQAVRKIPNDGI